MNDQQPPPTPKTPIEMKPLPGDAFEIAGVKYSGDFFRHFSAPDPEKLYRFSREGETTRIERLDENLQKDLAEQALSLLVIDLGYASEPLHGEAPHRHQFMWGYIEKALGTEAIPDHIKGMQEVAFSNAEKPRAPRGLSDALAKAVKDYQDGKGKAVAIYEALVAYETGRPDTGESTTDCDHLRAAEEMARGSEDYPPRCPKTGGYAPGSEPR